jgi:hypothetical protein
MKELTNITDQIENKYEESTYALLIRSEEKNRDLLEAAIYPLLIIGAVVAIYQFAMQPVKLPLAGFKGAPCAVVAPWPRTLSVADEISVGRHSRFNASPASEPPVRFDLAEI